MSGSLIQQYNVSRKGLKNPDDDTML